MVWKANININWREKVKTTLYNDNNCRNSVETGMGKRLRLTWVVGHGGPGDIHGVEGDERGLEQTRLGLGFL